MVPRTCLLLPVGCIAVSGLHPVSPATRHPQQFESRSSQQRFRTPPPMQPCFATSRPAWPGGTPMVDASSTDLAVIAPPLSSTSSRNHCVLHHTTKGVTTYYIKRHNVNTILYTTCNNLLYQKTPCTTSYDTICNTVVHQKKSCNTLLYILHLTTYYATPACMLVFCLFLSHRQNSMSMSFYLGQFSPEDGGTRTQL